MLINVALLEDEIEEQKRTVEILKRFSLDNDSQINVDVFDKSSDILSSDLSKYNLLLLDIILENENVNGMDVAKIIRENYKDVAIVFITKTVLYAIQGYEVNAFDYVVKLVTYEDISLKLKKYISFLSKNTDPLLTFKCTDRIINIKESEIYFFSIYSHYIDIHTTSGIFKCRGRISDVEKLVSSSFSRISRNCIINLNYLTEIKKDDIIINGELLKITENYKDSFIKSFNEYLMQHGK